MLVTLLQNEAVLYCKLFHFNEAVRCCNDALKLTKESADIFYRRSQAITYNKCSGYDQLKEAMEDIDTAIRMRPNEEKFKDHKKILIETIKEKIEFEKQEIEKIINIAKRNYERCKDTPQNNKKNTEVIPIKAEKPFEYRILKK